MARRRILLIGHLASAPRFAADVARLAVEPAQVGDEVFLEGLVAGVAAEHQVALVGLEAQAALAANDPGWGGRAALSLHLLLEQPLEDLAEWNFRFGNILAGFGRVPIAQVDVEDLALLDACELMRRRFPAFHAFFVAVHIVLWRSLMVSPHGSRLLPNINQSPGRRTCKGKGIGAGVEGAGQPAHAPGRRRKGFSSASGHGQDGHATWWSVRE
ncbi:MAG: hypothetical protein BWZ08_01868 [candidate division BRC1 bacterium ADurb.BinA292]|nr:MAG: hypothetical protein BWZ08_01868 [candidate division BRC1 bacterium ADurb.BinA292]